MPAVDGSAQLRMLAVRLKEVGARDLRLEMLRGLKSTAKPLIAETRKAAREKLPRAGGLNERVATSKIGTSVRTGARTAGVRIVASEHDARTSNFGGVRHPVFGHRKTWVAQDIPDAKGWFLDTLAEKSSDEVSKDMVQVLASVAAKLQSRPSTQGTVRLSGRP